MQMLKESEDVLCFQKKDTTTTPISTVEDGAERLRTLARPQSEAIFAGIFNEVSLDHHLLSFLWHSLLKFYPRSVSDVLFIPSFHCCYSFVMYRMPKGIKHVRLPN